MFWDVLYIMVLRISVVYNNICFIHFEYNTHPKHCTSKTGQGARGTYIKQTTSNACTCTEYMYTVRVMCVLEY